MTSTVEAGAVEWAQLRYEPIPMAEELAVPGWRCETVAGALERIFQDPWWGPPKAYEWSREIGAFVQVVLPVLAYSLQPLGGFWKLKEQKITPFGIISGGVARNWFQPSEYMFSASRLLEKLWDKEDIESRPDLKSMTKQLIRDLIFGPYDLDIKLMMSAEEFKARGTALAQAFQEHFTICSENFRKTEQGQEWDYELLWGLGGVETANVVMTETKLENGKSILNLALYVHETCDHLPRAFSLQITNYPEIKELIKDYRHGHHFCGKQNIDAILAEDLRREDEIDREYLIMAKEEEWQTQREFWTKPEVIPAPSYENLPQALIAGLRLIRMACLWPPEKQTEIFDFVQAKTIIDYQQELARQLVRFLDKKEPLEDYRAQEIIKEAILCLTLNPVVFSRLAAALGILSLFIPSLKQTLEKNRHQSTTNLNQKIKMEQLAHKITSRFVLPWTSNYDFERAYLQELRLPTFALNEIGPMQFLRSIQEQGCFVNKPLSLDTVVDIFDPRKISKRYCYKLDKLASRVDKFYLTQKGRFRQFTKKLRPRVSKPSSPKVS